MAFEREYRDLAYVPRWAILPTTRTQSVAEHSYYVSLYAFEIAKQAWNLGHIGPNKVTHVVATALLHDRDEAWMSDIPGPVKRNIKDPRRLADYVKKMNDRVYEYVLKKYSWADLVVKCADLMDEVAFLHGEIEMGNKHAVRMKVLSEKRLYSAIHRLPWFSTDEKNCLLDEFRRALLHDKIFPENNDDLAT